MRSSDADQVRKLRSALTKARAENSRMMAAAIGGHLRRITAGSENPGVAQASEQVKDATLHLLKSLHSDGDVATRRGAALDSVERLEGSLKTEGAPAEPSPAPQGRVGSKARGLFGRFTRRSPSGHG